MQALRPERFIEVMAVQYGALPLQSTTAPDKEDSKECSLSVFLFSKPCQTDMKVLFVWGEDPKFADLDQDNREQ